MHSIEGKQLSAQLGALHLDMIAAFSVFLGLDLNELSSSKSPTQHEIPRGCPQVHSRARIEDSATFFLSVGERKGSAVPPR